MSLEKIFEHAKWEVRKFHGDSTDLNDLYEVIEGEGNLLLYGGASALWQCLVGNGVTTAGNTLAFFSDANAYIGVGDTSGNSAATMTDLQGSAYPTNKFRKTADMTHTDSTNTAGGASIVFVSTFATGDANFAWNEWGIFNGASGSGARMLNRRAEALGTKTSAATWQLTITLTLGGGGV